MEPYIESLVNSTCKELVERGSRVRRQFRPLLTAARELVESAPDLAPMTDFDEVSLGIILQNEVAHLFSEGHRPKEIVKVIKEETYSGDIEATFVKHILPLVTAIWANSVARYVVGYQGLNQRSGALYYLNIKAAATKGSVPAGTTLAAGTEGPMATKWFASDYIDADVIGTGNGAAKEFSATLQYGYVVPKSFTVTAGDVVGTDSSGDGTITGDGIAAGSTIDYTTGAVVVKFDAAPAEGVAVTCDYNVDLEKNPEAIGSVKAAIEEVQVQAKFNALRTKFTVNADWVLSSQFGRSLDDVSVETLGALIKAEIDSRCLYNVYRNCSNFASPDTFDCTPPDNGISKTDHMQGLLLKIHLMKAAVSQSLNGLGTPNVIIGGTRAAAHVESAAKNANNFTPIPAPGGMVGGPKVLGKVGSDVLIEAPAQPVDDIVLAYKPTNPLVSGAILGEWLTLRLLGPVSRTVIDKERGIANYSIFKLINNNYFRLLRLVNAA